jgi:hypothetical protein
MMIDEAGAIVFYQPDFLTAAAAASLYAALDATVPWKVEVDDYGTLIFVLSLEVVLVCGLIEEHTRTRLLIEAHTHTRIDRGAHVTVRIFDRKLRSRENCARGCY